MEKVGGSNSIGLYQNKLKNGDIAYYYTIKIHGKLKYVKVGTRAMAIVLRMHEKHAETITTKSMILKLRMSKHLEEKNEPFHCMMK